MHLIHKVFAIALMTLSITSACLDKTILSDLGFSPLSTPETVAAPGICKKINGESKTFCAQASLGEQLRAFQVTRNKKENKHYKTLKDTIEDLVRKFSSLDKKLKDEKTHGHNEITEAARIAIEEAKSFMPSNGGDLAKQIKEAKTNCLLAQNKASVGAFCLLSSDIASNFVSIKPISNTSNTQENNQKNTTLVNNTTPANNTTPTNNTTPANNTAPANDTTVVVENKATVTARLLEEANDSDYSLIISAQESAVDHIVESCFPLIRASCIYRQVGRVIDELNRGNVRDREGCYREILGCEKNVTGCSPKAKALIVEKLFGPFNTTLVDETDLEEVDDYLTDNFGNAWDKTKEAADDVRDSTVNAFNKSKNYINGKLSNNKTEDEDEDEDENKEVKEEGSEEEEEEETNKSTTDANVNASGTVLTRLLTEESISDSDEDDNKKTGSTTSAVDNNTYPSAYYNINSNGRDLVTEANYAGVAIEGADILSVFIGLFFIAVQLLF